MRQLNPINNKWQNNESISAREFPTISQIIQRFDLIFILRENTTPSHLSKYVEKRKKIADDYKKGVYEGNEEFIKKYLLHARTFKPELTDEAHFLLKNFYINMGKAGISGLARKLDALIRITIATAKLKLKDVADVEDAQEAMLFYNDILKDFNQASTLSANPRDLAYEEIRKTIKENNGSPVLLTEAALMACNRNKNTRYYLLGRSDDDSTNIRDNSETKNKDLLKLNKSWKLRQILLLIRNDNCMQIVEEKPVSIRWVKEDKSEYQKEKQEKQCLLQVSVQSDTPAGRSVNKKENNCSTHIQDSVVDNPVSIIEPCDVCDGCDATNEKEKIPIDKYPSINSPLTRIEDADTTKNEDEDEDEKTDSTSKHDCLLDNSNVKTNTAATTEFDTIQVIPNNPEIKKFNKLLPSSHSSHSSHSISVNSGSFGSCKQLHQ